MEKCLEADRPRMTIRRMRLACWIPKATNIHREYVILLLHRSSGCTNAPQCYFILILCVLFNVKPGGTCILASHGAVSGSVRRCEVVGLVRLLVEIDCVTALHNWRISLRRMFNFTRNNDEVNVLVWLCVGGGCWK